MVFVDGDISLLKINLKNLDLSMIPKIYDGSRVLGLIWKGKINLITELLMTNLHC